MNSKDFLDKYLGMLIGIAIAVLLIAFNLVDILVYIGVIILAGWLGKYVQQNKDSVKEKLKALIDKF